MRVLCHRCQKPILREQVSGVWTLRNKMLVWSTGRWMAQCTTYGCGAEVDVTIQLTSMPRINSGLRVAAVRG